MKSIAALTAFVFLTITGSNMKIELSDNTDKVKISIQKIIPSGTDIYRAKALMEKNGFTCKIMNNSSFSSSGRIYDNIDFLYCDKEKGFPVSRRWQVAIVFINSRTVDILISTGLTGP